MCGRYDNLIAKDAYRTLFKAGRLPRSNFPPRYNIAPTDQIPIIRVDPQDGERELVMARWGLIPFWMKEKPKVPHINARAETVHKLPLFREAFARRRCLIPATGFYEWQRRDDGKQPYRFRRKDLEPKRQQSGGARKYRFLDEVEYRILRHPHTALLDEPWEEQLLLLPRCCFDYTSNALVSVRRPT
jgi:SOS response associated peptidase (SRAP)